MRYELSDGEWDVIRPRLSNKARGIPRVDDRRILNGIFWVLRSAAPWCDLPGDTVPIRLATIGFVRWRQAGVWDRIMEALAGVHDAAVQMIDTSVVRVHQHGSWRGQQGRAVSIKLSIVGVSLRATASSQPTTLPS